jgi:WD40 repeat protein
LKIDYEFPFQWIRWHPRGHLVLAGSEDSTVWMWNADKGACINTFSGHGGSVTCGDFTPDGIYLLFFSVIFLIKEPSLLSLLFISSF